MVAALIKGKRIEIHNLDDLLKVVETSRKDHESLILIGEQEERLEVIPYHDEQSALVSGERLERALVAAGAWKDLVDTEQLKRDIYESRGQAPRPNT